jgi:hypothetical protein
VIVPLGTRVIRRPVDELENLKNGRIASRFIRLDGGYRRHADGREDDDVMTR